MKRITSKILFFICISYTLIACSEHNKLVGTKWYCNNFTSLSIGRMQGGGGTWNVVYEFLSNSKVKTYAICLDDGRMTRKMRHDYEYMGDSIAIKTDDNKLILYICSDKQMSTNKTGQETPFTSNYFKDKPQWQ